MRLYGKCEVSTRVLVRLRSEVDFGAATNQRGRDENERIKECQRGFPSRELFSERILRG